MDLLLFAAAMIALLWFTHKMVTNYPELPTPMGFHIKDIEREERGLTPLDPIGSGNALSLKEETEWQKIIAAYKTEND